jgi:DNA-binding MarR family transcriptional regulator
MPPVQVDTVADLLHSASIHLLRRAHEVDDASGLTPARLSALSVVVFRGPLTLGALAQAEGVRSATMTGVANGLEAGGLIQRRPHERDRRAVLLVATPKGRRLLRDARRRRIEVVAELLRDLSPRDLELLQHAGELIEDRFALPGLRWQPVETDSR